jgi:riboflavin kinase/FMN adenylyltransferase
MRVFRHFHPLPSEVRGSAVAVGNFDGVHRGHRMVIEEAGRIARSLGLPWAVLTFEPHPRRVFKPSAEPFRLTPFHAKARFVEAIGVDVLVVVPFDRTFARLSPRDFVHTVLVHGLAARWVVSGHNFAFGHDRAGTPEALLQLGGDFGFDYTCVHEARDDAGVAFSSTRVRACLARGDLAEAESVLGRPFEIEGRVVAGERRGRLLGFPTANLRLDDYARPAFGVYAVRIGVENGVRVDWYDGVANLGVRPSFGGNEALLEAHLFDFEGDLYGRHLRVALIDYLRPEKRFDGLDQLKAQIAADSARARALLAAVAPGATTAGSSPAP